MSNSNLNVRIVPNKYTSKANGTKVFVGDKKLVGVQRIELVAEPNKTWKAVITVIPENIDELLAEANIQIADVTKLQSDTKEFAAKP